MSDFFVPTKADMEHCPLCDSKFVIIDDGNTKDSKNYFACLKPTCLVSIHVQDPQLGRWRNMESEACPICQEPNMRMFFRQDKYIKMRCRKCGYAIENVDSDKHAALMKKEEAEGKRKTIKGLPNTGERNEHTSN